VAKDEALPGNILAILRDIQRRLDALERRKTN
jgi:hypothetical protein